MRSLLLCLPFALLFHMECDAQHVYFFGGPSLNRLYNIRLNSRSYLTDYTNGLGYFLGYGISIKNDDSIQLHASVRLDHAEGGFNYAEEQTLRHNISGQFSKTTLGVTVGFQPFKIMKRFETLAEVQLNTRLHTRISGYDVKHNDTLVVSQESLSKTDTRKFMSLGFGFAVAYSFYRKKDKEALVFYRTYTGITNELKHTGTGMKLRSGSIGILYRLWK